MGQTHTKINNAKVRHYEDMLEPDKRLYEDPYAKSMYNEGMVHEWILGEKWTAYLVGGNGVVSGGFPGLLEMISIRTKWLDDAILSTIQDNNSSANTDVKQQLVILNAGFDTRAFRLPLSKNVQVFEIDQTSVFQAKLDTLFDVSRNGDKHVAQRLASKRITYVPAERKHGLARTEGYSWEKPTIVVFEDVTQYVSKETSADQLTKMANIMPKGSKLLLTYADQACFDHPAKVGNPAVVKRVLDQSGDQKWITGFAPKEMKAFLGNLGYEVEWDTTAAECHEMYLGQLGRALKPKEILSMERFVVAKKKDVLIPW